MKFKIAADNFLWSQKSGERWEKVAERCDVLQIVHDPGGQRWGLDVLWWPRGRPTAVRLTADDSWVGRHGLREKCQEYELEVFSPDAFQQYLRQRWTRRILV